MFLFDVCEEGGIAEVRFSTGTLIVSGFDDKEVVLKCVDIHSKAKQ